MSFQVSPGHDAQGDPAMVLSSIADDSGAHETPGGSSFTRPYNPNRVGACHQQPASSPVVLGGRADPSHCGPTAKSFQAEGSGDAVVDAGGFRPVGDLLDRAERKREMKNRNREAVEGLRKAADWLESHPDLPGAEAIVTFGELAPDTAYRVARVMDADLKYIREVPGAFRSVVHADVNDAVTVQLTGVRGGVPKRWIVMDCPHCTYGCEDCDSRAYRIPQPMPVSGADFLEKAA